MYTLLENGTQSGARHGPSGISGITFSMALGGESFNVACESVACALPVRALSGHWPRIPAPGGGASGICTHCGKCTQSGARHGPSRIFYMFYKFLYVLYKFL